MLCRFLLIVLRRGCFFVDFLATMAPNDDLVVYRTQSSAEHSVEKPTFKDGDKALEFLRCEAEDGEAECVDERALVRKVDFMIV